MRRRITATIIAVAALLGFGGITAASAGASVTASAPSAPGTHYNG